MKLDPEQGITPDNWVILEIEHEGEKFQKILAGWSGSYLYGDSWRMSSPIKNVDRTHSEFYALVETESSSVYNLFYQSNALRMNNASIYNQLKKKFGDKVNMVELS